jgi:protein-disulfide isomerase
MNRTAILIGVGTIFAGAAITALVTGEDSPRADETPQAEVSAEGDAAFGERVRSYLLANPEVIFEAAAVMERRQQEMQGSNDAALIEQNSAAIFDDGHSWVGGNPNGDVTLVEFMDYRCGYCRRAYPEVEELITSDGNIRIIVKEFPILGEQSTIAARYAIAAQQKLGDEAYKALHDALMNYKGEMTLASLGRLAEELDLDTAAIEDHMGSDAVSEVITENRALAETLQISGTPSFVMENQILRGYVPLEGMQAIDSDIRG